MAAYRPEAMTATARTRRHRRVKLGAWDPALLSGVDALEKDLGRPLDIVHFYQGWGDDTPAFDATRAQARGVRDFGRVVKIRFAHEMNHVAYPWCVGVNGNTGADYVRAWRHVVRIFRAEGARNARFVWCPLPPSPSSPPLAPAFLDALPERFPAIVAVVWFNDRREADWRLDSSAEALESATVVFRSGPFR